MIFFLRKSLLQVPMYSRLGKIKSTFGADTLINSQNVQTFLHIHVRNIKMKKYMK
jgi:hypothetical protein